MADQIKKKLLIELGKIFRSCANKEIDTPEKYADLIKKGISLMQTVEQHNSWFTSESVQHAFYAWGNSLVEDKIEKWVTQYNFSALSKRKVGIIAAGNIPLVGLHDALCVLIKGDDLIIKLSSKDQELMNWVFECIATIDPTLKETINVSENFKEIDKLIATGSDNSSRYFDYYFKNKKRLIRKNRTSVAVLKGDESAEDLVALSRDVFTHFGLGCRNVTKLFVPKGYDLDLLFNAFYGYKEIINHNKYANNYDYNKAVYLLNQIELIENGFLLLKEDQGLHSPVGVLFYEYYDKLGDVMNTLEKEKDQIQCRVGKEIDSNFISFGKAQQPELWDYADGIDTLKFLIESD